MGRMTGADNVAQLFPSAEPGVSPEDVRIAEALVFAAAEPLEESTIAQRLSEGADVEAVMDELRRLYEGRGVNLVRVARRWMFRTADDLSWVLARDRDEKRKLSRAALETLAIVAYHQPVTRADIEQIRGVVVSKGALDVLMEARWVRMRGRRKAPGRPNYLRHDERVSGRIRAWGDRGSARPRRTEGRRIVRGKPPVGYDIPQPDDGSALRPDEDSLHILPARASLGACRARRKLSVTSRACLHGGIDGVTKARKDARALKDYRRPVERQWSHDLPSASPCSCALLRLRSPKLPRFCPSRRIARLMTSRWLIPWVKYRSAQTPVAATGLIAYEFEARPARATRPISAR